MMNGTGVDGEETEVMGLSWKCGEVDMIGAWCGGLFQCKTTQQAV